MVADDFSDKLPVKLNFGLSFSENFLLTFAEKGLKSSNFIRKSWFSKQAKHLFLEIRFLNNRYEILGETS